MSKTILEEIIELRNLLGTEIYLYEYICKKKLLKARIDYEVELRLYNAMLLHLREKITKSQYDDYKQKIIRTKEKYKELLSTV